MVVLQAFGISLFAIKFNIKCLLIRPQTVRRDNEHFRSLFYLFSGNLAGISVQWPILYGPYQSFCPQKIDWRSKISLKRFIFKILFLCEDNFQDDLTSIGSKWWAFNKKVRGPLVRIVSKEIYGLPFLSFHTFSYSSPR